MEIVEISSVRVYLNIDFTFHQFTNYLNTEDQYLFIYYLFIYLFFGRRVEVGEVIMQTYIFVCMYI